MKIDETIQVLIIAKKEIEAAYKLLGLKTSNSLEIVKEHLKELILDKSMIAHNCEKLKDLNCPIKKNCIQFGTKDCNPKCKLYLTL
jgi:hypothetical protein